MLFRPILVLFEKWISPFAREGDLRPPRSPYGFLWFYVRQARGPFGAMLALGGVVAILEAGLFYFTGLIVDILADTPKAEGWAGLVSRHGGALAFMAVTILVIRFLGISLSALVEEQSVVASYFTMVRWQAYRHVARQSLTFFQNDFSGRIVTKVLAAGQATGDLMVALLQVVWFMVVYSASTIALFAALDWHLAAIVAAWIVFFGLLARYFVPRVRRLSRANAETSSMLNGRIVDAFANIQTLKLFGRENDEDRYIREGFEISQKAVQNFARYITGVRSSLAVLSGVMITMIGATAIDLWFRGVVTSGGVALALGLVLRLNMLLGRLMTQFNSIMRNLGTIQNSAELISEPIRLTDAPGAKAIAPNSTEIRFEAIRFHYGKGSGVIDDLSLVINPGEKVGIVGRSGAGKSTLVNLMLRFYDLEGGRILIGGEDIATVTQASLRAQIGMVTQDTALLHRSIRDNILLGKIGASDAEVRLACERAEAWDFVEGLRDQNGRKGLDAHVGERGVKLSGGQRQRIAIARVMLKDAPILVLDEATSSLDSEAEAAIQSNLDRLMQGKTVLAIAHRLSTIAALDRLVIMDRGRIIEQGTHSELLERGGLYAALWARQSGGFLAASDELDERV